MLCNLYLSHWLLVVAGIPEWYRKLWEACKTNIPQALSKSKPVVPSYDPKNNNWRRPGPNMSSLCLICLFIRDTTIQDRTRQDKAAQLHVAQHVPPHTAYDSLLFCRFILRWYKTSIEWIGWYHKHTLQARNDNKMNVYLQDITSWRELELTADSLYIRLENVLLTLQTICVPTAWFDIFQTSTRQRAAHHCLCKHRRNRLPRANGIGKIIVEASPTASETNMFLVFSEASPTPSKVNCFCKVHRLPRARQTCWRRLLWASHTFIIYNMYILYIYIYIIYYHIDSYICIYICYCIIRTTAFCLRHRLPRAKQAVFC